MRVSVCVRRVYAFVCLQLVGGCRVYNAICVHADPMVLDSEEGDEEKISAPRMNGECMCVCVCVCLFVCGVRLCARVSACVRRVYTFVCVRVWAGECMLLHMRACKPHGPGQ